jgi:hypothetical protein
VQRTHVTANLEAGIFGDLAKHGFYRNSLWLIFTLYVIVLSCVVRCMLRLLYRFTSHRHEIDAIPVTSCIGNVVSQMGSRHRNALAVLQAPHILPVGFFVPETGPAVLLTLLQKVIHGATNGSHEQELASHRVVKLDGPFSFRHRLCSLDKVGCLPVARVFGVVTVEIANAVGRFEITVPTQLDELPRYHFWGQESYR